MTRSEERTAVKTYVPAYQKEIWAEHADELDVSTSEFVRTMVQAGRRGFGGDVGVDSESDEGAPAESAERSGPTETGSEGLPPRGDALETVVLEVIREEPRDPPAIVDEIVGNLEDRIFDVIDELGREGVVERDMRTNAVSVIADE